MQQSIAKRILEEARGLPEGSLLSAKRFLHLGSRESIDQALSRMAKEGILLRVKRGAYVIPISTRFGVRAPTPERVVAEIAETTGETITPNGAIAANALGLTTQVPVRQVFLTSGRSRRFVLGRQTIELRHAPSWQLRASGKPAGEVVRALSWLGPKQASRAAAKLVNMLPEHEKAAVLEVRQSLPTWLAEAVSHAFVKTAAPRTRNA